MLQKRDSINELEIANSERLMNCDVSMNIPMMLLWNNE